MENVGSGSKGTFGKVILLYEDLDVHNNGSVKMGKTCVNSFHL